MNNLGCYYKKVNKPNVALRYMLEALRSDVDNKAPLSHIASTKLNICAILSILGKHLTAIQFAREAVTHLEHTLKELSDPECVDRYTNIDKKSLLITTTIAYFNLAAEYEHSKDVRASLDAYGKVIVYAQQSNLTELRKYALEAKAKLSGRLDHIRVNSSMREYLREEHGATRSFNDSFHISYINDQIRKRNLMKSYIRKSRSPYKSNNRLHSTNVQQILLKAQQR